ncbi:MAG: IS66 family insertion sequence element accessory protein TnpB [Lachnospiraceae bacterium]|nr:hypothetical protein [Prevotella sp.]MBR6851188.1 IS66 family insertion sequence element accessory protein TnpB [Lachnospiraceae bacterium]
MDQTTHEVRLEQWTEIITQCQNRSDSQTAKEWLAENGISEKTYYYWLRKIRRKAYDSLEKELPAVSQESAPVVALAELPTEGILTQEPATALTIRTRKSTIEISTAVSDTLMVELVKAVAHAL